MGSAVVQECSQAPSWGFKSLATPRGPQGLTYCVENEFDARKRTRPNAAMRCGCQIPQVLVSVTGVTDGWRHFLFFR